MKLDRFRSRRGCDSDVVIPHQLNQFPLTNTIYLHEPMAVAAAAAATGMGS